MCYGIKELEKKTFVQAAQRFGQTIADTIAAFVEEFHVSRIPYAMMMIYFDTKTISSSMIPQAVLRVITGESFGHLWYMYILIGI